MALADLTSVTAVGRALDEFDALGRDAFLRRYGFGQAKEYFILRSNRLYDSKAVAGAAHGFQFPEKGALRPSDFSGGEATVERKLLELGFDVVRLQRAGDAAASVADSPVANAERAFHDRMIALYKDAKAIGYNATRFLAMINELGGLETARTLLRMPNVSEGYTALWERKRLDLTVEAAILESQWQQLFSDDERSVARKRLTEFGYTPR